MKKQTKRLFYVIAIAIMVAVISVACKKKPTAVTEFQIAGGPFNDYDYKNLKPYTKTWGDGFKALYKDGKEVAHVKIDGNTIQVHVSALGNLIFKATR